MSESSLSTTATEPKAAAKPRNRRLNMRRVARGGTKVTCRKGSMGLGPNIALSMLDVSESGVRLLVTADLKPRQEVEVSMQAPGQLREIKHVGQVVWTVPASDGTFCIGVQFDRRLSYAAVQDLGRLANK